MEMSEQVNELASALSKAQAAMAGAKKDAVNPYFKSNYATLAAVWDACREPLATNGLSVVQAASTDAARVTVSTLLLHASGQWVRETLTMTAADPKPQSVGSAISYARRYQLAAMVGVAPEDDDAEGATGRTGNGTAEPQKITQEQVTDLETLIENVGTDKAKLLQFFKVAKLSDLTAPDYAAAVRMLEKKKGK